MPNWSRRTLLRNSFAFGGLASPFLFGGIARGESPGKSANHCTLGFSTYGMQSITTERAIAEIARLGFDSLELVVRSGWDADSALLAKERRRSLKRQLSDSSLQLASLMEHVFPTSAKHQTVALERLKLAADVAHDLSPQKPPVVQTVLGGGKFEEIKNEIRDRLGKWVDIANATETTIAIKPHRGGAVSHPAEAVWLIDQLGNPKRLRMLYDYSHYAFRDLSIDDTIRTALPYTVHIAVKDAVQTGDKIAFKLPGEAGTIDFATIIRKFHDGGYRGDFNCEVSSMVSKQENYDPLEAAQKCYAAMSVAFDRAGVPRAV